MIDWDIIWQDYLGIGWSEALGVIASTIVLYAFFSLLVHISGQRLMANPTVGSFVVLAVIGGVTARAMLGESPTLLGALIVLNTLMLLERLMGTLGRTALPHSAHALRHPAVVMIGGTAMAGALRRRRLSEQDLLNRLRISGVLDLGQVELVILENRGTLTIVHTGSTIAASLVADVDGREAIPERLLTE
ncbi:DUF421 domain-containing protein [Brachybacterium alimentarium]|uniref:DUF421 domain-containing protein n=1 Tax=Brachybacterium alimentarium TaxID=47845 RepID=UPI003FD103E5